MTIIAPTPITELPLVPSLSDVSTFSARTDAFINALPAFRSENNALATNVYNNATAAETSASAAAAEVVLAAAQASTATTQAGIATTQVGIATTQAGIATTQAGNAASVYATFDSRYLGDKTGDPALDNLGNALVAGALYFNTAIDNMRIYTGTVWVTAAGAITGNFSVSRETHTATASQTLFNLTNSYTPGLNTIMVYRNGVRLLSTDYTETSGSSVTLTTPSTSGDEVFFEIGVVSSGTSTNAGNITFNPAGGVASTNVQDAIAELGSEKQVNLVSGTNIKTLNGTSLLGSGDIVITSSGTGGTTSTASITLTASSAAAMSVTPATPGLYVTLPDATTCTKADNLYSVYNAGDYDYGVKDSAGTQLGWIRARTGAMIGLADNSTAAGVWAYYGLEKTGITASYVNSTLTNMGGTIRRIALDSNRTCFLFGGVDCYAIVYDASTQTWGSATLVRATVASGAFLGVLSATNQVLVVSCDSSNAIEAVTLTIATNTVTVNTGTKATATLTGGYLAIGTMIAVGSSWVFSYANSGPACTYRAVSVSGTTPTIGTAATVSNPNSGVAPSLFASGSVLRVLSSTASSLYCRPVTVSGVVMTTGTETSATTTAATFRAFLNGNGNIVCHYINTTHYATIFKLTGTVEAASSVSLGTTTTSIVAYNDFGVISASKTLFTGIVSGATWYANILTDTAGTASAGTQLSGSMQGNVTPGIPVFNVSGTTAYVAAVTTTQSSVLTINCSGASPTLTSAVTVIGGSTITASTYPKSSDIYGVRNPWMIRAGSSLIAIANYSVDNSNFYSNGVRYTPSSVIREEPLPIASQFAYFYGVTASDTESYLNVPFNNGSTGQVIQRIEAAA